MCVLSVGKASVRVQPSLNTRELTQEKNLINVFSVVKDLDRVHTLSDTRESTDPQSPSFHVFLCDLWVFLLLLLFLRKGLIV